MSRKWRRGMQMDKEQYGKATACLVSCMQEGYSWQVAKAVAGLQISQSSAYRLWRAFRQCGEVALSDRRHGHPSKLRGAARAFLEERCRQAPQTPSSTIQMELQERLDLCVSISQINRVRVAFGISNHAKCPEPGKKALNGNLVLSDAHFEGIPEEVSSSSHVMFAVQRFFGS